MYALIGTVIVVTFGLMVAIAVSLANHLEAQAENDRLRGHLALVQMCNPRQWKRSQRMLDQISFTIGASVQEREHIWLFLEQFGVILGPIVKAVNGRDAECRT